MTCDKGRLTPKEGGAKYPEGRTSWLGSRGMVDLADTIAAIKKVVFDDKKCTMAELMDACANNWEGREDLRELCLSAPKYGNDDDYVDEIYDELSTQVPEIMTSHIDPITGKKPCCSSAPPPATSA